MKASTATCLGIALAALVALPALAGTSDVWLTTKAKVALLTADGVTVTGVSVDSVGGAVTIHGKVKTDAEKDKATLVVKSVAGVNSVNNLLQVVPDAFAGAVKTSDEALKEGVVAALKADKRVEGVSVASVSNGVVILSGKASTPAETLRAIELAWNVGGVSRVTSEIETADK